MPRLHTALALALLVCCLAPAAAQANDPPYAEPSYTKPVGGVNHWYWEATPPGGVPTAYCFSFAQSPFTTYFGFSTGETPATIPASNCTRHDTGRTTYDRSLTSLQNGETWRYCTQEWVFLAGSWSASAYPVQCMDTTIDSQSPTVGLTLDNGATFTDSASIARKLTYSDSVSPPWPDNRICTVSSRACTGSDTFNYDSACSTGTRALSTTYTCTYAYPGADGTVWQCAYGFDSASVDAAPNRAAAPALNSNPSFPAGTGNASSIACDSIVLDRVGPVITAHNTPTAPTAGQPVAFSATATDAPAGLSGAMTWDFGDGGTATGTSPTHTYATPGTKTVTIHQSDAAGNQGAAVYGVLVKAVVPPPPPTTTTTTTPPPTTSTITTTPPPTTTHTDTGTTTTTTTPPAGGTSHPSGGTVGRPPSSGAISQQAGGGGTTVAKAGRLSVTAPRRLSLKRSGRRLPLKLAASAAGTVKLTFAKGRHVYVVGGLRFSRAGSTGFRLRLPSRHLAAGGYTLTARFTPTTGRAATKAVKVKVVA
jgi:PKD repeat protein